MGRKECYLFAHSVHVILRLNLSDFCEGCSNDFEYAYNYFDSDGRVPIGMGCMVVGSKIYMVGGEYAEKGSMLRNPNEEKWLNLADVYAFDPTKSEDGLVPVRDGDGAVPRLNGSKNFPFVVNLEGKFYLLSRRPMLAFHDEYIGPVFEVFDSTLPIPSWKALPPIPSYNELLGITVDGYFAWGHKLVTLPDLSMFDAKDEKWTDGWWFAEQFGNASVPLPTGAAVEFKGIQFAVPLDNSAVIAYDLDADGHLKAHWVLDELSEVFGPPKLFPFQLGLLTDLGDGRMCLLFNGLGDFKNWIIRMQVFQVYITHGERPVVQRERLHSFDLRSWKGFCTEIHSVFMWDHSNKSDIEADASSGSYSCENLKKRVEHAVEYVNGDSKKPKTTLPE